MLAMMCSRDSPDRADRPIGSRPLSRPAEAALDGFPGARVEVLRPSQVSPQALTVTFPASGSMYEPRTLSASTMFANASASTFLRYVFQRCRPSRSR
jgi:hypothetical protein